MVEDMVVLYIISFDGEMKADLRKYCEMIGEFRHANNAALALYVQMSFFEKNLSFLPFVRKDRFDEYYDKRKRAYALSKEIETLYKQIADQLNELVDKSVEAVRYAARHDAEAAELAALDQVAEALKSFQKEFTGYNWFFHTDEKISEQFFSDRYPDVEKIYSETLEKINERACIP